MIKIVTKDKKIITVEKDNFNAARDLLMQAATGTEVK